MADTQPKKTTKSKAKVDLEKKETSGLAGLSERLQNKKRGIGSLRKDIEVEIMNNTNGKLFYRCPKTGSVIQMVNYGDTEILTMEQLNAMKNTQRKMLENFWIVLVDVYDEEITLDDVLVNLRLDKAYSGMKFDSEILQTVIVDTDYQEFQEIIHQMNPQLVVRVAERMKLLNIMGEFGDMYKMNFIAELMGKKDLFTMNNTR